MSRFTQIFLLSVVCTALTNVGYAAADDQHPAHPGGWHIGATSGMSIIDTGELGGSNSGVNPYTSHMDTYSLANRSYTGGIYLGYDWAVSNRWVIGVEGGYQYLGHSEWLMDDATSGYQLKASSQIRALNALLTAKYWLANQVNIFSKFGVVYEQLTRNVTCESGNCYGANILPLSNRADETRYYLNPELQLGLGWQLTDSWNINLAYQRILGANLVTSNAYSRAYDTHLNPTIDSILLGVDYQFLSVPTFSTVTTAHASGWYLGAASGLSVINNSDAGGSDNTKYTSNSNTNRSYAGGIYLGYDWAFSNRWSFGAESGYQYLGRSEWLQESGVSYQEKVSTQIRALNALLTAKYWLSNQFNLFSKMGVAYKQITRNVTCEAGNCGLPVPSNRADSSSYYLNPELQLGLGWQVADRWNINLAYQHIMGGDMTINPDANPSIDSALLGIDYQFSDMPRLNTLAIAHLGGWHVGITSGLSVIDTTEADSSRDYSTVSYQLNNRSYAGGFYAGYDWALSNSWLIGVESGYQYLGHIEWQKNTIGPDSQQKVTTQLSAINALLTAKYWVSNQFNLFSKFGVAYEQLIRHVTCESGSCSLPASNHVDETDYYLNPELQIGLGWQLANNWNINLAYQRIMGANTAIFRPYINPTIESVLLGVDYQFTSVPTLNKLTLAHSGGWYAGITDGLSVIDTNEDNGSNSVIYDALGRSTRSYASSIYAGYDWQVADRWNMGFESGYQYLGRSEWMRDQFLKKVSSTSQIQAIDALLTAKYWLSNQFDLIGKVGVAYEQLTRHLTCDRGNCAGVSLPASNRADETRYYLNPELQIGLGWQLADHWNLNFVYQRVLGASVTTFNGQSGDNETHINPTIESVLLGVDYQFSNTPVANNITLAHLGGWYLGLMNGLSIIDSGEVGGSDSNPIHVYSVSDRSYTANAYLGYEWVLDNRWNTGVEGGYQYLGHNEWLDDKTNTPYQIKAATQIHALDVLLTAKYWLSNRVDVFSKFGVAYEQLSRQVTCESGDCSSILPASNHADEIRYYFNPELQAGLGWQVADHWNVNAAYQRIFGASISTYNNQTGTTTNDLNPTISSVLLGVDYYF